MVRQVSSWVTPVPGGVRFQVRVQPRAGRDAVCGVVAGALKVQLTALPVAGAANERLQEFLGKLFHCAPSKVRILKGARSRVKLVEISGIKPEEVLRLVESSSAPGV